MIGSRWYFDERKISVDSGGYQADELLRCGDWALLPACLVFLKHLQHPCVNVEYKGFISTGGEIYVVGQKLASMCAIRVYSICPGI